MSIICNINTVYIYYAHVFYCTYVYCVCASSYVFSLMLLELLSSGVLAIYKVSYHDICRSHFITIQYIYIYNDNFYATVV